MRQRMSAQDRRAQLLEVMHEMHKKAASQADFTAEKIATQAGISTVMLYRLVRSEFQMLRAQLAGPRLPSSEVTRKLRSENADMRRQLREAQDKLRTTAVEELDEAIRLVERLEEENLQLRGEIKLLRKRLEEGSQVFVHLSSNGTADRGLKMLRGEKGTQEILKKQEE